MTLLNFVTQEELDNLHDDPRMAFMELVNHAQRRLSELTVKFDPDDHYASNQQDALEKSFMNIIIAAGKDFEIEPFASMIVPRHEDYRNSDYEQFKSDLDHYITQLILRNRTKSKGESVAILPLSKEKIRVYVHGLRDCIEKASMDSAKKRALLDRLDDFEKELEKRRMSFVSLSLLTIAFVGAPGSLWASADITHKLITNITNITQIFTESKQLEDETRQIGAPAAPKELSPPSPFGKCNQQKVFAETQPNRSGRRDTVLNVTDNHQYGKRSRRT